MSRFLQPPPATTNELILRAEKLAGRSIGQLAELMGYQVPANLKRKKGWQGQFIEDCLGADSGNLSQPDFNHLGIELKTLPIDFSGRVLESTYVCVLNLNNRLAEQWEESAVFKKLSHVLWVPVAKTQDLSVMDYQIASPFLCKTTFDDLATLKQDWEDAMALVSTGKVDQLNARFGQYLQVRPKAANSRVLTKATNEHGETIETLPRGFYLRPSYTQTLLDSHIKCF